MRSGWTSISLVTSAGALIGGGILFAVVANGRDWLIFGLGVCALCLAVWAGWRIRRRR
jgi:hypothetical protein